MAKKKQNNRDDFTPTTVSKLGKRVGFVCSNPGCRIHTVGPNEVSDKTSNIGKAAHICAAAENGPRYDPKMTPAQRSGIDNGIWLCGNCHDIVDADPVRYPADLLREWKQQAEDAASNRLGKPVEAAAKNMRQFPLKADAIPLQEFVPGSRDTELAALRSSLERENIVYLWGFGGMGKTETAIRLAHDLAPEGGVFLLHYQNSMRETILKLNFEGYKFYAPPSINTPEAYAEADLRQRMKMLREGYRNAILIVDNFDVEGKTLSELQSEPACQDLLGGGFRLIFTTRSPFPRPEWEIRPMTPEYRLRLMRNLAPDLSATDQELNALIEAVDGHTLTLVLMARTLSKSWGDVTPAQMLAALKDSRWDALDSPHVSSGKDRDNTQRRIESHLAALFDLSDLSEDARTVLSCATLLPDGGMTASLFRKCLSPAQKEVLVSLAEHNWLTRKEGLLIIHPVMRQVCRMALKPNDTLCGPFLESLWSEYDEKAYDAEKYHQMAACFAVATDTLRSHNAWYPERSGFLFLQIAYYDHGLEYCQKALALLREHDPDNGELMGIILHDIAGAHSYLGSYQTALEFHEKALNIRITALPPDHPDLARSYDGIGNAHNKLGNYKKALELAQTALDIRKRILPPDHPDLARSYANVGAEYNYLGDRNKALELAQTALDIHKRILPLDHPDLAHSYDTVGAAYSDLGNLKKALELSQTALDIRRRILPPEHPDLAHSYDSVSAVYDHLGNHRKALELSQTALDIRRRILPQDHPDLAHSCQSVAVTLYNLRRPKEALPLLQEAMEIRQRSLPAGHPDLTMIYNDLAAFHTATRNQSKARHFRRLAAENQEIQPK